MSSPPVAADAPLPVDESEKDEHPRRFDFFAGVSWSWGEQAQVQLVDEDTGPWGAGVYLSSSGRDFATWSARPWAETPGWIPLLLMGPEDAGIAEGGALWFAAEGSAEHGCDPEGAVEIVVDHHGLEARLQGMPYFALPMEGAVLIDEAVRLELSELEEAIAFEEITGFRVEGGPMDGVTWSAPAPMPWFQLQPHEDFVEVDVDHSCEAEGAPRSSILRVPH